MMTGLRKYAALGVMMAFFAALALDITVPALVLSAMAAVNWLVLKAPDDLLERVLGWLSLAPGAASRGRPA